MDPFFGDLNNPLGLHRYVYVHGDPINGFDPSGEFGLTGLMVGFQMASSLREMKIEADMAVFDAMSTMIYGLGAGQNANQIVWAFLRNQAIGFGIGLVAGRVGAFVGEVFENGIVIGSKVSAGRAFKYGDLIVQSSILVRIRPTRGRLVADIAVDGLHAPVYTGNALAKVESRFGNRFQRQRARQWIEWGEDVGAVDLRVDVTQVNAAGRRAGINEPDLQLTLEGGSTGHTYELPNGYTIQVPPNRRQRVYVEFDDMDTSDRAREHAERILLNDPIGIVVAEQHQQQVFISNVLMR